MLARPRSCGRPTTRKAASWLSVCGRGFGFVAVDVGGMDVFWANADAYKPGRNSAQDGKSLQELQREWELPH